MNSHKATFLLSCIKKPHAHSGTSRETCSGEKQTYFMSEMYTKLARIKNLKNLNIGTDRPMQTV